MDSPLRSQPTAENPHRFRFTFGAPFRHLTHDELPVSSTSLSSRRCPPRADDPISFTTFYVHHERTRSRSEVPMTTMRPSTTVVTRSSHAEVGPVRRRTLEPAQECGASG
jgi:hypothetical protein